MSRSRFFWNGGVFRPGRRVLAGILLLALWIALTPRYVACQEPAIVILEPVDGQMVSSPVTRLMAEVAAPDGKSLEQIQVWVNGEPVLWQDKGVEPVLPGDVSLEVGLEPGENQIVVLAKDELGQTVEHEVTVSYNPSPIEKPSLYILSIGVRDYADDLLDLSYSDADAEAIVDVFSSQTGRLFEEVKTHLLLNERASKGNVLEGLDWILSEVTQHDMAIVFVSGHGVLHPLREYYYFLPYEGDPDHITRTGVPWFEFENVLAQLAGKTLFLVDTCHAGGVTGAKGVACNLSALRDFATAGQGVIYMTSSTGNEISREAPDWGHGAFTRAILDGLEGTADHDANGVIYTNELDSFVTNRVKELTGNSQRPTTDTSTGYTAFPVFVLSQAVESEPTTEPVVATPKGGPPAGTPSEASTPGETPATTETSTPTPDMASTEGARERVIATAVAATQDVREIEAASTQEALAREQAFLATAIAATMVAQATPADLPATTPTSLPLAPLTAHSDTAPCVDEAQFVWDLTVPDGTQFGPGDAIDKTWRVKNTGTCAWGPGYELRFVEGARMEAPRGQPVQITLPGETADIEVRMVAPATAGEHTGLWQISNARGESFGQRLSIVIQTGDPSLLPGHIAYVALKPGIPNEVYDVHISKLDGTDSRVLWEWGRQPQARRSDGRIVLNSEAHGKDHLWAVNMDGSDAREVSLHREDAHPGWSMDGTRLLFDSQFYSWADEPIWTVWTQADVNQGTDPNAVEVAGRVVPGRYPVWLENGWIVYNGCNFWEGSGNCGLYAAPSGGIDQARELTDQPADIATDSHGDDILFFSNREENNWDVYTVNFETGGVTNLTNSPACNEGMPTFSPDGNMIAFASNRDGAWGIWAMNADGSNAVKCFDLPGGGLGQDWTTERISWGP